MDWNRHHKKLLSFHLWMIHRLSFDPHGMLVHLKNTSPKVNVCNKTTSSWTLWIKKTNERERERERWRQDWGWMKSWNSIHYFQLHAVEFFLNWRKENWKGVGGILEIEGRDTGDWREWNWRDVETGEDQMENWFVWKGRREKRNVKKKDSDLKQINEFCTIFSQFLFLCKRVFSLESYSNRKRRRWM